MNERGVPLGAMTLYIIAADVKREKEEAMRRARKFKERHDGARVLRR